MVASGFAGLGYQIVWTQQAALWLGHEAAAVLAVVTAFFGGLALGALLLGSRIARSPRPERWYAGCELAIACWSLVLAVSMAPLSEWMLGVIGAEPSAAFQWTVAFVGSFVLLLPATAAMGATLPAMERVTARLTGHVASIGALYAANTFGATLGVLASAFWLVPTIGLAHTALLCALLNLLCAALALNLSGTAAAVATPIERIELRPLATLAATGLLGIGYEILVVRVLSQVNEDTVYTFAILLAIYLVGSAIGATIFQRWSERRASAWSIDRLLTCLAAACLLGSLALHAAPTLKGTVQDLLGDSMAASLAAEAVLALVAFLLPTLVMGMLFSALSTQARAAGIGFGRALAANTLGGAVAPILFGVLLAPLLGPQRAIVAVAVGYLAATSPSSWRKPAHIAVAGLTLAAALWAPTLAFVDVPQGGRIVSYREGALAAVSVVEDAAGVSRLRIDNRQQEGSSSSLLADARQALLPLLLHPAPRHALFLGLGTGMTAASAAADPTLQVDAVELLPEVIAASAHFTDQLDDGSGRHHLRLIAGDARRFVRTGTTLYDVIVADNFHPARSGSGSLYTVEHFQAVGVRLAPGGLFCQWLPLHQLDLPTLRSIVRSFLAVHPGAWAVLATNSLQTPVLGLVARQGDRRFDLPSLRSRLGANSLPQRLVDYGLGDDFALLGSVVAGPHALARFAGDAPLNTDDRPVVAYLAPRITYAPDSLPRDRLLALLKALDVTPGELLAGDVDPAWQRRLAAYWSARDRFLVVGRDITPTADVQRMLAQVREPLLSVLRISPDFRPAADPLLRMATVLAHDDGPAARTLLNDIARVAPSAVPRRDAQSGISDTE